jgi:hypothetical protein
VPIPPVDSLCNQSFATRSVERWWGGEAAGRGFCGHKKNPAQCWAGFSVEAPGGDLLLHGLGHTTIGAGAFHFRVRDGIGWFHTAMAARDLARAAHECAGSHRDLGRECVWVY